MASNSSLEKIHNFSFPSNHLLNFQLMRDLEKVQTLKPEYFFFIGFVPGVQGNEGARTYDFDNAISLKYAVHEMCGLSFALKQYAQGNGKHINYVKFSKSSTGQKTITLEDTSKTTTDKSGAQHVLRQILFKVTNNGNTKAVSLTLDQAYAIGETLDILFKKATELEFNRAQNTSTFTSNNKQQSRGFNQNPPQQPPSKNNFNVAEEDNSPFSVDNDDNSNYLNGGFSGFGSSNPFG